jgi:hypothetical protein
MPKYLARVQLSVHPIGALPECQETKWAQREARPICRRSEPIVTFVGRSCGNLVYPPWHGRMRVDFAPRKDLARR